MPDFASEAHEDVKKFTISSPFDASGRMSLLLTVWPRNITLRFIIQIFKKLANIRSQNQPSLLPVTRFSRVVAKKQKNFEFRVNTFFETNEHSVQTADDNRKISSEAR